ncbi:MAG: Ca2+-dependent phosphoinositide-specific phospholipase C [Verrucomicrobiota bacterium JB023]|nr:Ca2+-dependent phosphoinositide-specific phospholipase C [Verrucomicrobiota bacterium JB023]
MKHTLLSLALLSAPLVADPGSQPLSHFQVIGTHNSYHLEPGAAEKEFIALKSKKQVMALEYSHPPLKEQFDQGIRQIELDLFADPEGGRFAEPAVFKLAAAKGGTQPEAINDSEGKLKKPGTKVLHFPEFDFRSNYLTLTDALAEVRQWSLKNPKHFPILVLLELKGSARNWEADALLEFEQEILTAIPKGHLLTPDDVRGRHANLRSAIEADGWPSLDESRGRIILALDNTNEVLAHYLEPDPLVKGRLMFPSCPSEDHPSAAWFKMNDPVKEFELIKSRTEAGFLVRTRADSGTWQARRNDVSRRDTAFASGAQFISTDFPKPNPDFSTYAVTLPNEDLAYHLKDSAAK